MKQYHIYHSTGINKFEEVEVQPRNYAGFVNADSLEKAFEYAQNDHVDWAMNEVRSTSVGDVIQDNDKFFMVCGIGFKELIDEDAPLSLEDMEAESQLNALENQSTEC